MDPSAFLCLCLPYYKPSTWQELLGCLTHMTHSPQEPQSCVHTPFLWLSHTQDITSGLRPSRVLLPVLFQVPHVNPNKVALW